MDWLKSFWSDLRQQYLVDNLESSITILEKEGEALHQTNKRLKESLQITQNTVVELEAYIDTIEEKPTPLELVLLKRYKRVPNIAYKQKRRVDNKWISVYLNQMITPDAFEVQRVKSQLKIKDSGDILKVGDWVAEKTHWESDKILKNASDFYQYAEETIVTGTGDCEDHVFLVCSILEDVANLYCNARGTWHSTCLFQENGELYVLETNDTKQIKKSYIFKLTDKRYGYDPYLIVTRNMTFEVNGSIKFGIIANW